MSVPSSAANMLLSEFQSLAARQGQSAADAHLLARLNDAAPTDVVAWLTTARELIGAGYALAAVKLLDETLRRFPGNVDALYWRGNALRISSRFGDAEQAFRTALDKKPSHRDAALSLAIMLRDTGRLGAAAETVAASVNARGANRDETIAALIFLRECGQHPLAHALAQQARNRWPRDAAITALAAEFALAIGEFPIAREALRATLDINPGHAASWLRLAYCQRYTNPNDSDLSRLDRAWNEGSTDTDVRICTGFALGKALDDLGEYERAAGILRQANALASLNSPWSTDRWQAFVERRLRGPALPKTDTRTDFTPVFIVGLPRTGTTLLASLLARNPHVRDRGELNWIDGMFRHLLEQNRLDDPQALEQVAQLVARQMRRDDAPAQWYLDKNPLNFRYLDLIAAMFPQARIIHCRRNLRDTALSLWSQYFAHADLDFSYDFSTIHAFTRGHERLMVHWRENRVLAVHDLDYEALVTDTEKTLQGLADFLGMARPAGAETSSARRSITTASVWQARQPVYKHSIGRWRHYAGCLPELERHFHRTPETT